MKKVITSVLVVTALGFMSCGKSTPHSVHPDSATIAQAEWTWSRQASVARPMALQLPW
jgi:hypothetical protein